MAASFDKKTHHIHILSDAEINDLYAIPQLAEDEMALLFELNTRELAILISGLSMERKILSQNLGFPAMQLITMQGW